MHELQDAEQRPLVLSPISGTHTPMLLMHVKEQTRINCLLRDAVQGKEDVLVLCAVVVFGV